VSGRQHIGTDVSVELPPSDSTLKVLDNLVSLSVFLGSRYIPVIAVQISGRGKKFVPSALGAVQFRVKFIPGREAHLSHHLLPTSRMSGAVPPVFLALAGITLLLHNPKVHYHIHKSPSPVPRFAFAPSHHISSSSVLILLLRLFVVT
jgi:hypothetical protein